MTKKNCEYNLDTKYIELIKEFQEKQKITKVITVKDTEKDDLDPEFEKKIIKTVYETFTEENKYFETTVKRYTDIPSKKDRNIQFPITYINLIHKHFIDDKIIFYGSLALDKEIISDYDLMYIPEGFEKYQNHKFNINDLDKMYDFLNEINNKFNNIDCINKIRKKLTPLFKKEYNFVKENKNTLTLHNYKSGQIYSRKGVHDISMKTFESDKINRGFFKISMIPNLWLDFGPTFDKGVDDNIGIRFCLFRIKFMLEKGGKYYSIPILDLSYHFCNRNNTFNTLSNNYRENYIPLYGHRLGSSIEPGKVYIQTQKSLLENFNLQLYTLFNPINGIIDETKKEKIMKRMSEYLDLPKNHSKPLSRRTYRNNPHTLANFVSGVGERNSINSRAASASSLRASSSSSPRAASASSPRAASASSPRAASASSLRAASASSPRAASFYGGPNQRNPTKKKTIKSNKKKPIKRSKSNKST